MDALSRMLYFLSYYEQNTTSYKTLVILLENLRHIPTMSILEVAELCFVSTATISRLIQDMNFSSYSSFREEVAAVLAVKDASSISNPENSDLSPEFLSESAHKYMNSIVSQLSGFLQPEDCKTIISLAHALKKAKSVCFLISTTQTFLPLQRMLFLDGKRATVHKVFEEGVPFAEELVAGDILFTSINGDGECQLKCPLLEKLRKRNVTNVVMSKLNRDWPRLCDYVLPPFYASDDAAIFLYGVYSQIIQLVYNAL